MRGISPASERISNPARKEPQTAESAVCATSEDHLPHPNDQFEVLEEKLQKAIGLFKRNQTEKRALEQEVAKLKGEHKDRSQSIAAMEKELITLRKEREDVRGRIEKLLQRIETLTRREGE
jgi:chromosome segregation ATPase